CHCSRLPRLSTLLPYTTLFRSATFASHIHRIQQVLTLAAARRRRVALLGRSMEKNVAIASELGYLRVPSGLLAPLEEMVALPPEDRKSTRLNSSHVKISYAVFC